MNIVALRKGFATSKRDGILENRTVITECMLFAVFAIGIDIVRQRIYKLLIDFSAYGCKTKTVGHGGYDNSSKS